MSLITKSDCMNVRDLNHTVRPMCHVVYVFSKFPKDFHNSPVNKSDQIAVGLVLYTSDCGTTKT